MTIRIAIETKLQRGLSPLRLSVVDESHLHAGHAGARPGGESHFRVEVISECFAGKPQVERHRMVNALLAEELRGRVHALSLSTLTVNEAGRNCP